MKPKRSSLIMEIAWAIVAFLSLLALLHSSIRGGIRESWPFFLIFILATGIYLLRRTKRIAARN